MTSLIMGGGQTRFLRYWVEGSVSPAAPCYFPEDFPLKVKCNLKVFTLLIYFFRNYISNMFSILLYTLYPGMQIPPVPNPASSHARLPTLLHYADRKAEQHCI